MIQRNGIYTDQYMCLGAHQQHRWYPNESTGVGNGVANVRNYTLVRDTNLP